jgi:WD40 repeat protein
MKKLSVVLVGLLLAVLILLGFIAGKFVIAPEQEDAPTPTLTLEATDTPTQTATPLPTISPVLQAPLISPPMGLLYESDKQLWYKDNQNSPTFLLEIPEESTVSVSRDGSSAILSSYAGDSGYLLKLVDLSTSTTIDLYSGDNYSFCGELRWPNRADILLVYLEPKEYSGGMYCEILPAILFIKTQERELIGSKPGPENLASISPDGKKVAFGNDGEPWIYSFGQGSVRLNLQRYGFPTMMNDYFSSPSWSPSGRYLAWVINGTADGESQEGVGVFDMSNNISRFFYPYHVLGYDIRSRVLWNPDEQSITLVNRTLHVQWIIALDGGESTGLPYIPSWNPAGNVFAHLEYDRSLDQAFIIINDNGTGQINKIILPLELEIHSWLTNSRIDWGTGNILYWDEYGQKLIWSPDGKYLVVGIGDSGRGSIWNWLVDVSNLQLYRIDLPEYAKIYQFLYTEK